MKTTFLKINEQERLIDSFNSFGSQFFFRVCQLFFLGCFSSLDFSLYKKEKIFRLTFKMDPQENETAFHQTKPRRQGSFPLI